VPAGSASRNSRRPRHNRKPRLRLQPLVNNNEKNKRGLTLLPTREHRDYRSGLALGIFHADFTFVFAMRADPRPRRSRPWPIRKVTRID